MTSLIFIDANIPIYAGGRPHPLKDPCLEVLRLVTRRPRDFFTNAEVFQELLHRYIALHTWSHGKRVVQRFGWLMEGRVEPITWEDIRRTVEFLDRHSGASARDLLHWAVMVRVGCSRAVSADLHFGRFAGIERLDPLSLGGWQAEI